MVCRPDRWTLTEISVKLLNVVKFCVRSAFYKECQPLS